MLDTVHVEYRYVHFIFVNFLIFSTCLLLVIFTGFTDKITFEVPIIFYNIF